MPDSPDICRECGGNCCRHPIITMEEYAGMVRAIGKAKTEAARPERFGNLWIFREICPGKLDGGCVHSYDERPLICKMYPFLAIPSLNGSVAGHELLLDLRHCPRWKEFGDRYEETKEEFLRLKEKESAAKGTGQLKAKGGFRRR